MVTAWFLSSISHSAIYICILEKSLSSTSWEDMMKVMVLKSFEYMNRFFDHVALGLICRIASQISLVPFSPSAAELGRDGMVLLCLCCYLLVLHGYTFNLTLCRQQACGSVGKVGRVPGCELSLKPSTSKKKKWGISALEILKSVMCN